MSEPRRLLEQSSTSASTLELLRALEPPHAPPPAVRAALVKDLSGLVASSGVKAAAAATWLKVSLVAVLGVGAGGALFWSHANSAPHPPSAAAPERPLPASPSPPAVAAPLPPAVASPPLASSALPAPERAKSAASSGPRDSLAEEEALLEAARKAVPHNAAQALALLQKHRSQFPSGQLSAERMYLSIDCWQRLGNLPAAKREAAALAKYYPNSAYARRAPLLLASPAR